MSFQSTPTPQHVNTHTNGCDGVDDDDKQNRYSGHEGEAGDDHSTTYTGPIGYSDSG